jgi:nucleoside 2-deoxyribosyltransferase
MVATVEKREQVFISSTFKDLVEERQAVTQTLLQADCFPAGMELFPASDAQKFDLIKQVIDLCDYYVVIVGGRYGSVDDDAELSYTEMEYDYAVAQGIPVMGFLHGDPGQIPAGKTDLDSDLREKLNAFREKVEQKMVRYWREPADLAGQVALAIMQIRKSHPREGWVRAGSVATPEMRAEAAELKARVRELEAELRSAQSAHEATRKLGDLAEGDAAVKVRCDLEYRYASDFKDGHSVGGRREAYWDIKTTWNEILRQVGPDLMDEGTEAEMADALSALCLEKSRNDLVKNGDDDDPDDEGPSIHAVYEATVDPASFDDVKVHLAALGLIENGTKKRTQSDQNKYWKLTQLGKNNLLALRAFRRDGSDEASES